MPEKSGNIQSKITRSGSSRLISCNPSWPVSASLILNPSLLRLYFRSVAKSFSSSTIIILADIIYFVLAIESCPLGLSPLICVPLIKK